jgi:uncharacterized membrane protein
MALPTLGRIFVRGLVAILPVAVTLSVFWWLATTAESSLGALARRLLGDDGYVPGTGVVLGFALVLAVGVVMQAVAVRRVYAFGERLLEKLPLVKTVYGPVKDLMRLLASSSKERRPHAAVRVTLPGGQASLIGFQTRTDASELTGDGADHGHVAVYLPMSYQIGGYMVLVPKEWVQRMDWSAEDVLRVTLTAGMSQAGANDGAAHDEDER